MNVPRKRFNPWKAIVLTYATFKVLRLAHKVLKAKRLAKKQVNKAIVVKYDDL